MMADLVADRRSTDSGKWSRYPEDVLPLWVADMDFRCPEPVVAALRERVEQGVFGYGFEPRRLTEAISARLWDRYGWQVTPDELVFLPGVVPGLHVACRAASQPGDAILIQTPVYGPFRRLASATGRPGREIVFPVHRDGTYRMDWDAFHAALAEGTRVFVLCNPQNPTGRVFSREELTRIAEACARFGVTIVSDEIHCDLLHAGHQHIPIASLDGDIARRVVTLMAPSKTFNLAGLQCAFAVIQDPELRARFETARSGIVPHVNILGIVAALAAFRHGQPWLDRVLSYLSANRDFVVSSVRGRLPGVAISAPEGTHLAWLDCRGSVARRDPYNFFLERARVATSDGSIFGSGGEGFVRLNFACGRAVLSEALDRMATALAHAQAESRTAFRDRREFSG